MFIRKELGLPEEERGLDADPDPFYQWVYRPEMQFSVFDLKINELRQTRADGSVLDVYNFTTPLISVGDAVDVIYSLLASVIPSLQRFGREVQLVLSLGEKEINITIAENGSVRFADLSQLADIKTEDFILMSLYMNNDPENLLWEFAFKRVDLDVDSDNNNDYDLPDSNELEDSIESIADGKEFPGKIININYEDDDEDLIPAYADMDSGGQFVPAKLTISGNIDLAKTRIRFVYLGSDPEKIEIFEDEIVGDSYVSADGLLRIWTKDGNELRIPKSVLEDGDYIPQDKLFTLDEIGITNANRSTVLYLEAVALSITPGDFSIQVELVEED